MFFLFQFSAFVSFSLIVINSLVFSQFHFPNTVQIEHAKHTTWKKDDTWVTSLLAHFTNLSQLPSLIRVKRWLLPWLLLLLLYLNAFGGPYIIFPTFYSVYNLGRQEINFLEFGDFLIDKICLPYERMCIIYRQSFKCNKHLCTQHWVKK